MAPLKNLLCSLFLALALPLTIASAQVIAPGPGASAGFSRSVFGIGFFGGPATGLGLSFRHHLPSVLSYQITAGAISIESKLSYDFGVELQIDVFRSYSSRFYVGGGTSYFYSGNGNNTMNGPVRLGLGVGIEYAASPGLHVMGDLFFTYFSDGTVLPLPQLGFFYYFE